MSGTPEGGAVRLIMPESDVDRDPSATAAAVDQTRRLIGRAYLGAALVSIPLGFIVLMVSEDLGWFVLSLGWLVPLASWNLVDDFLIDLLPSGSFGRNLADATTLVPLLFWLVRGPALMWLSRPIGRGYVIRASRTILMSVITLSALALVGTWFEFLRRNGGPMSEPVDVITISVIASIEICVAVIGLRSLRTMFPRGV